jgi:hypothetical protein
MSIVLVGWVFVWPFPGRRFSLDWHKRRPSRWNSDEQNKKATRSQVTSANVVVLFWQFITKFHFLSLTIWHTQLHPFVSVFFCCFGSYLSCHWKASRHVTNTPSVRHALCTLPTWNVTIMLQINTQDYKQHIRTLAAHIHEVKISIVYRISPEKHRC